MKIKSKVVKSTINNKDILETFQELLGTSEYNACLPVAHPKYIKLQTHVNRFIRLLSMFKDSAIMLKFPEINEQLNVYIKSLEKNYNESFTAPDLEQFCIKEQDTLSGHNYNVVPPNIKQEFSKVFTQVKKCNIVNIIIVTCKNLMQYQKYIEDKNKLNDNFLTKSPGNLFTPLPELVSLNFKKIYNETILNKNDKSFILIFLSKMYEISHNTYEVLSTPDVDVNEFIAVILTSIDQIKKHIPRCNEAFDKIVESVDILKTNFDGYYKDFLSSNNNTAIIMENFVLDVSKNTKATPKITSQFRRIIAHYRKIASQNTSDPRLKTLFKHVEKNFDELEKYQKEDNEENEHNNIQSEETEAKETETETEETETEETETEETETEEYEKTETEEPEPESESELEEYEETELEPVEPETESESEPEPESEFESEPKTESNSDSE